MKAEIVKRIKERLLKDENVLLAYLFGSQIKLPLHDNSDLDVAVLLKDDSWANQSRLMEAVAQAANISTDKVDLVNLSKADELLKYQVLNCGVKLLDRGFHEQDLCEKIYQKLADIINLSWSYFNDSFSSVSREIIAKKIMVLDEEVSVLKTYVLSKSSKQIVENPIIKRVLRDSLRVSIESIIDVCKHIVASKRLGVIRDYKDFPLKLAERGLMDRKLAERVSDYAKLRNIIVHRYIDIDYNLLYEKASELVNIVSPTFRLQIKRLLK